MTDEVTQAAARWRAKNYPEPLSCCDWRAGGRLDDAQLLADAYVGERDETPIKDCYHTGEDWRDPWLLAIGFKPDDTQDFLWINSGYGATFDLQAQAAGPWVIADSEYTFEIPRPKTRGDVRRLCSALGIELKETK